jgi:7-cyano-7-deazaguanine synthase
MITAPPRSAIRGAVVLLSGGIDSATVLAVARSEGFAPYALSFRYGQRHAAELAAAGRVAAAQGVVRHLILDVDVSVFGGSALTDPAADVPAGPAASIDATYVPARNTVFLSLALAWAETIGARDIFIGVNAGDHDGYPDCRPGYLAAFQQMAGLATSAGPVQIRAPLIRMTKAAIIRHGLRLGVDYTPTLSCYNPAPGGPCGACGACSVRAAAFTELGIPDPALAGDRR